MGLLDRCCDKCCNCLEKGSNPCVALHMHCCYYHVHAFIFWLLFGLWLYGALDGSSDKMGIALVVYMCFVCITAPCMGLFVFWYHETVQQRYGDVWGGLSFCCGFFFPWAASIALSITCGLIYIEHDNGRKLEKFVPVYVILVCCVLCQVCCTQCIALHQILDTDTWTPGAKWSFYLFNYALCPSAVTILVAVALRNYIMLYVGAAMMGCTFVAMLLWWTRCRTQEHFENGKELVDSNFCPCV